MPEYLKGMAAMRRMMPIVERIMKAIRRRRVAGSCPSESSTAPRRSRA